MREFFGEGAVTVIRAGRYRLGDRNFETVYWLEDFYALHCYNYAGVIRCGEHEHRFAPGDVTLTPPGCPTRYAVKREGMHLCTHFECRTALELPFLIRAGRLSQHWSAGFNELADLMQLPLSPERQQAAQAMLGLMLFRLHNAATAELPLDRRISQLLYELNLHSDRALDVGWLAKHFGLSQTHLTRLFKAHTGMTVGAYVRKCRVEKARFLLSGTNRSVKEIALAVGYGSAQELNKRFRQVEGIPPSAVRGVAKRSRFDDLE